MRQNYLIMGCARSGLATAKFLANKGEHVILTDSKEESKIIESFPLVLELQKNSNIKLIFGQQPDLKVLDEVKEIIMSPGVPLNLPILEKAREEKIKIISEIELAYRYSKAPIIAITGTNGKTTTTTLVGEIFKNSGRKTFVVGNIGDPIINYIEEANEEDVFIAEISSFQLETIENFKPVMTTILNISPDHLDRHKTMENYIDAKYRIIENMNEENIFVLNKDDSVLSLRKTPNVKVLAFSIKEKVRQGAYYDGESIILVDQDEEYTICKRKELKIPGMHNVQNALAAVVLSYFGGVSIQVIQDTLLSFKGVEHRLEFVSEIDGITFINDSKGTNTDASTIAIKAFDTPIVLIAGGYDKKVSFDEWMDSFEGKVKYLVVLGATADQILETAERKNYENIEKVNTFEEAVLKAYENAENGDTVLLSPACASWGMFVDFEERGRVFKDIVKHLGGK
ncbi:UDP-N-acetylmuramoyl-L-alanine--D-glutamate ligase [Alkalibaculum bacchi]|uniref:UDP-N-acetylmuramoyl-L-alanine--D-glutamate ligase n=1 Tax=Alkalibaculum bacchi TaxID=645887 RepID=UPI0026EE4670|nr:UDP-N-acetylmuramoyl-L-alanine--D-glutamate ligase [Alkalibaculum bacchi]